MKNLLCIPLKKQLEPVTPDIARKFALTGDPRVRWPQMLPRKAQRSAAASPKETSFWN
jgi:hypothetical protein